MWDDPISIPPNVIEKGELRNALGRFATGVCVVTTISQVGKREGLTVNSFTSVSLNPPMVQWSIIRKSPSAAAFSNCRFFAVNVLSAQQQEISTRFSRPAADKFADIDCTESGLGGVPLIAGVVARFECSNQFQYYGGDHILFVGAVERFQAWEGQPLIFFNGRYAKLRA